MAPIRLLVFGFFVILATASAACGSSQPQSPLEVLQRSHDRSKDIESFRAHIELDIMTPDGPVLMASDMEACRNGRVRTVISIDAFGDKESFETIVAEPYVYVELPDEGWTQVSAATIAASIGQSLEAVSDPTAFYSSLFPIQDVPWELYAVESLGREEVDGVQTEHLSIQFDFQKIWQHLDEEQRQQFLQASPGSDEAIEYVVETTEVERVEVWIDDKGYTRRAIVEELAGGMSIKLDMRMFDINRDITIKLPEDFQSLGRSDEVRPRNGATDEVREIEYQNVVAAVSSMLIDNDKAWVPDITCCDTSAEATNDMSAFPDSVTAAGSANKLKDKAGNSYTSTGDGTGFVLYGHDALADSGTGSTVNYLATQSTKHYYTIDSNGNVHQWDAPGGSEITPR